jgi:trans-aconitate 2-methyltransferase
MAWNPEQYLKFAEARLRPAMDLLAQIALEAPSTIYDLGCGPGNVTRLLAKRWPGAAIVGVDDSSAMLQKAAEVPSRIAWRRESVAHWKPDGHADLIFSNAALHWLPNHASLFPRLVQALASNGVLAVQMPRSFAASSHLLVEETVRSGPWRSRLEPLLGPPPVADPQSYYRLMAPFSSSINIWECEYLHTLHGLDPVKEWMKGSWLKQFLDALGMPEREMFEDDYGRRVREAYRPEEDGTTLFPFRRLFMIVTKA